MGISRILDRFTAWLPMKPAVYLFLVIIWAVTLWFLSASNAAPQTAPDIPHLDKLAHFFYFLGGGAAMASWIGLRWPCGTRFRVFAVVVLVFTVLGRLDEYHQSFVPGRTGNDTGDWIADILGAAAGALLVVTILLPRLLQKHGKRDLKEENVANTLD